METKDAIRQRLLERRGHLAPADAFALSVSIRDRLGALPAFQKVMRVFTYFSAKDNEVDTLAIIGKLLEEGKEVACPAVMPGNELAWRKIESLHGFVAGRFGIPEPDPKRSSAIRPTKKSVVLVPGIAFSHDGHRVGFGGGYFDRFLRTFPGTSIGLAYDFQVLDAVPHEPHDVSVDIVVTDKHTYTASENG